MRGAIQRIRSFEANDVGQDTVQVSKSGLKA